MPLAGTTVNIGGRDLLVPSLSVGQFKRFTLDGTLAKVRAINDTPTVEEIDAMVTIVLAAIQRAQPEVDRQWLEDNFDFRAMPEVATALWGAQGPPKAQG